MSRCLEFLTSDFGRNAAWWSARACVTKAAGWWKPGPAAARGCASAPPADPITHLLRSRKADSAASPPLTSTSNWAVQNTMCGLSDFSTMTTFPSCFNHLRPCHVHPSRCPQTRKLKKPSRILNLYTCPPQFSNSFSREQKATPAVHRTS